MFIVGLITIHNTLYGQMSQGGVPYSFESDTFSGEVPVIQMTDIDESTIDSIKTENGTARARPYQFAYGFDVNIDVKDSSRVDSLDIGLLHRLKIVSDGAKSINLIFDKYHIPAGAKLFIYSEDQEDVKGTFTSGNNKESQIFPTLPVKGDTILIEYFEPYSPEYEGELNIGKVSHAFIGSENNHVGFEESGPCHVDINCNPEGNGWQQESRSVLMIIKNGTRWCSATLVNNTNEDGTAYVLTANHCVSTNSGIQNSVFVFNYESPTFNGEMARLLNLFQGVI